MVSVIIPVYNRETLIERCIDSLQRQDYTDIEIILVDDGSTDNTGAILRRLAEGDSRIKLVFQKNGGPSKARNAGLDICTGEYIVFIDSDDTVLPNYISQLLAAIENADISVCNRRIMPEDDTIVLLPASQGRYTAGDFIEKTLMGDIHTTGAFITPTNRMFRSQLIKQHNIRFNEKLHNGEDTLFNLQAIDKAEYVSCTENTEYIYHDTRGSLSYSTSLHRFDCYRYINPLLAQIVQRQDTQELDVKMHGFFVDSFLYKAAEILNTPHDKKWKTIQLKALLDSDVVAGRDIIAARGKTLPWLLLSAIVSVKNSFALLVWFVLAPKMGV